MYMNGWNVHVHVSTKSNTPTCINSQGKHPPIIWKGKAASNSVTCLQIDVSNYNLWEHKSPEIELT